MAVATRQSVGPARYSYVVFPPGSAEGDESFPSIAEAQAHIRDQVNSGAGWRIESHAIAV